MQHSTARRIDPTKAATKRQATPKASNAPRKPGARQQRPTRIVALREELERIERDMKELTGDFEARIKPLTRAFEKAYAKLLELDPPPKPKRGREPRSRYTEPRG